MENFDAVFGVIRFNWVLMTLNTILIIHFFGTWYLSYKKTGWKIDYWNFTMFLIYFVPFLLMYPFAGSPLNVVAVGDNIDIIQEHLNDAYLISCTGYISIYLGRYIFNKSLTTNFINYIFIFPFQSSISRLYISITNSKLTSTITFGLFAVVFAFIISMAYKAGMILSPSVYFQSSDTIRPMYNFMLVFSSVIVQIFIARVFVYNTLSDKIILGIYLLLSIFIGARGTIVYPIIQIYTFYIFLVKKGKVNLIKLIVLGGLMLFFVIYLGSLRGGDTSVLNTLATLGVMTFYGNSFSDLRDFSWVMGMWDGVYLNGKTYLAAFISFVPSGLSSFRTQWSLGKVTAVMAGLDPLEHPGLRPGLFGESYLNFGIPGVIFLGLILGYGYRFVDYKIKMAANNNTPIIAFTALMSCIFIFNLPTTSGFFNFYCTIVILLFLFAIKLLIYKLSASLKSS
jgi:oligosaccharide repeat unit polymerase